MALVESCPQLEGIELINCQLPSLVNILELKSLKKLDLSWSKIPQDTKIDLKESKVMELNITGFDADISVISKLINNPTIEKLNLSYLSLATVKFDNNSVKTLILEQSRGIDSVLTNAENIESLVLNNSSLITKIELSRFTKLQKLHLQNYL